MNFKYLSKRVNRLISYFIQRSNITKRQRFIAAVFISSVALFISEYFLGKSGIFMVFTIAFATSLLLFVSLYEDLKENFYPQIFILPFFYSLAFGLFYLLIPARFLTRMAMTSLYGVGLYSLFLSLNIFTVSSIRTIALLASARTVFFAIILLSYFFLANVVYSLHINLIFTLFLIFSFTFPMILASLWTYTLEREIGKDLVWTASLSVLMLEVSVLLWFWPSTPTLIALFMTGVFYTLVGLLQTWFEKRLFRGVIFEYFWVAVVTFSIFLFLTDW